MSASSTTQALRSGQDLRFAICLGVLFLQLLPTTASAQEPAAPQTVTAAQLQSAIDKLGDLDYATRTDAARTVRRTSADQAVPALLAAVNDHRDGYVRYRALVLLTGFNDSRTRQAMVESLKSPNDRLRAVAYSYFEHNPEPSLTPVLLAALDKESAEFVRPALVRALAASGDDPRVAPVLTREAGRGEDFFRSAVIEALGDYKARYAFDAITAIARLDGPLLDDSVLALGKMGDERTLETLGTIRAGAPASVQPSIVAATCLLGVECEAAEKYLTQTVEAAATTSGFSDAVRAAAAGLAALGVAGRSAAVEMMFAAGIRARDPLRETLALSVATVALRNTDLMLRFLEQSSQSGAAIAFLSEGFEILEEDLDKERFFARVRRAYWSAPEGSSTRLLMQTLIGKLDF